MKTVKEAQAVILKNIKTLPAETVGIEEATLRVLAEDVFSNRNHPPFDMSAMDGYAVRYEDISNSSKTNPSILKVVDDIKAGAEARCAVGVKEASCIMTGAPIPEGADTVVRVEDTDRSESEVKIFTPTPKGTDIRRMGENLKQGELVLTKGCDLHPAEVGILAMVKKKDALVYRRPIVGVISTGDELEGIDEEFNPRKIPDANSFAAMAQLKAMGVETRLLGIGRDNPQSLAEKLSQGLGCDCLIVSGGVSVGHHDFVRPTLASLGIDMLFWRVNIRPGHPFAFGVKGALAVFALPGNPVSSMVCFEVFILPALRKMMGAKALYRHTARARLTEDVKDKKNRTHFMRVKLTLDKEGYLARLTGSQGSAILMSMVEADGLMVVPSQSEFLKKDSIVTVVVLNSTAFEEESGIPD